MNCSWGTLAPLLPPGKRETNRARRGAELLLARGGNEAGYVYFHSSPEHPLYKQLGKRMKLHKRNEAMPQDRLTTNEQYLENQLKKRIRPPIKGIALKKLSGAGGYEVQPTITSGNEEKTLSLRLPLAARDLLLCEKSDLADIAQAIMTDLKQLIVS